MVLLLALLLPLAMGSAPALAQQEADAAEAGQVENPTVRDVIRMTKAGVPEQVMLDWLDTAPRPGALSADDLIALSKAKVPELVQRRLLELAGPDSASPSAAAPASPPPASTPTPSVTSPRQPNPPARPEAPRPVADRHDKSADVPVNFRLTYRPLFDEDEDPWDLFVYLNGDILTYNSSTGLALANQAHTFDVKLAPGRHVLRLLQERHSKRRDGYFHEARVCMEEVILEIEPNRATSVQLDFVQPRILALESAAKIELQVISEGEVLSNREISVPLPDDWRPLCEDIEANWPERVPRSMRDKFERCVRWSQLWQNPDITTEVPDRATMRQRLEAFDFRPVPATSR